MISINLQDTKHFMNHLLSGDSFDRFGCADCEIRMDITYHIDGRFHPSFFDSGAMPDQEYVNWGRVRPLVYSIIRGTRLPLSMKIVLALPRETVSWLVEKNAGDNKQEAPESMYINILYKQDSLLLTTGVSQKGFSTDRRAEQAFDDSIRKFLEKKSIL